MGQRLTDNNPDIADLSDANRPTKLAEKYKVLNIDIRVNSLGDPDFGDRQSASKYPCGRQYTYHTFTILHRKFIDFTFDSVSCSFL